MKILVRVRPNSKIEKVEMIDDGSYVVWCNAPPLKNKANLRVEELLALYFNVNKRNVSVYAGEKSRMKWIEVEK